MNLFQEDGRVGIIHASGEYSASKKRGLTKTRDENDQTCQISPTSAKSGWQIPIQSSFKYA